MGLQNLSLWQKCSSFLVQNNTVTKFKLHFCEIIFLVSTYFFPFCLKACVDTNVETFFQIHLKPLRRFYEVKFFRNSILIGARLPHRQWLGMSEISLQFYNQHNSHDLPVTAFNFYGVRVCVCVANPEVNLE